MYLISIYWFGPFLIIKRLKKLKQVSVLVELLSMKVARDSFDYQ